MPFLNKNGAKCRMLVLLLVLLLALAVLCGCAAEPAAPAAPEDVPEGNMTAVPESVPEPEPVTVPEPEAEPFNPDSGVRPAGETVDFAAALALPEPGSPDGDADRMAHNIYVDPDLSATSGQFSGFLIDFRAEEAGTGSYWALCNWSMNTDCLAPGRVTDNGGAYAGLQMRPDGPKSILSFWEIRWTDEDGSERVTTAQRIFPAGFGTNRFGGEGEGTNYIAAYPWQPGKWYRMYLGCYEDEASGHTFVDQWLRALPDGEWEQISCFDTGLSGSCFEGSMSQFMENYWADGAAERRSFEYCNLYVREAASGAWAPITSARLSVDTWWDNKKGTFAFGAEEHTLWGVTQGYGPDAARLNEDISAWYAIAAYAAPDAPQ